MKNLRYTVVINFKVHTKTGYSFTDSISERVASLVEARRYKRIIDDTVKEAFVFDNVKRCIAETWVGNLSE